MSEADMPPATAPARRLARLIELPWLGALMAGLGGALAIGVLAAVQAVEHLPVLIPPFGAARPRNVIGGHVISAAMGLGAVMVLGTGPLRMGAGVGLAIAAMLLTDTVHPPAGANPIVVAFARRVAIPFGACARRSRCHRRLGCGLQRIARSRRDLSGPGFKRWRGCGAGRRCRG
jgi:CBS-domain-containing membrane protein